jgi:hypothetical protein
MNIIFTSSSLFRYIQAPQANFQPSYRPHVSRSKSCADHCFRACSSYYLLASVPVINLIQNMDQIMQDEQPSTSRRRKRSSAWLDEHTVALDEVVLPEVGHTPSKRLLSARGEAIQTNRVIKYNARKLLNHLAFTQVYVTANFANYNPNSSFIILCVAARQEEMYQMLW